MWIKLNKLLTQKGLVVNVKEFESDLELVSVKVILAVFTRGESPYMLHQLCPSTLEIKYKAKV